ARALAALLGPEALRDLLRQELVPAVDDAVPVPRAIDVVLRVRRVGARRDDVEGLARLAEAVVHLGARGEPGVAALAARLLPQPDEEDVLVADPAPDDRGRVVVLRAVEEEHDGLVRPDDRPPEAQDVVRRAAL